MSTEETVATDIQESPRRVSEFRRFMRVFLNRKIVIIGLVIIVIFIITAVFSPIPYFLVPFGLYYLIPILIWSILLVIVSVRLLTVSSTVENVRKYERMITRSMILLLLALILEAIF